MLPCAAVRHTPIRRRRSWRSSRAPTPPPRPRPVGSIPARTPRRPRPTCGASTNIHASWRM